MGSGYLNRAVAVGMIVIATTSANANSPSIADRRNAERVMQEYARCTLASVTRRQLSPFLAVNPSAADAPKIAAEIALQTCLRAAALMKFDATLFRAALYDALYRRDFGHSEALPNSTTPALDIPHEVRSDNDAMALDFIQTRVFGDCVARRASSSVRTLLLADIDTKAEDTAFASLQDAMGDCLSPPGEQLHFSREILRGFLAEALYKLTIESALRTSGSAAPRQ